MNKKYGFLMAIVMFFSASISLAAEKIALLTYEKIIQEYNQKSLDVYIELYPTEKTNTIKIMQEHKKELESRKQQRESSYTSLFWYIASVVTGVTSVAGFGAALYGAWGSYSILERSVGSLPEKLLSIPMLDYWGFLKYLYGYDTDIVTSKRGEYTENIIKDLPSAQQKATLEFGKIAPPLAIGSLLMAFVSRCLFNKAMSYKKEIAQLQDDINRDADILKILNGPL